MSAKVLQRALPTTVASYLPFRGWICQGTLCDRSSVTFDLRQYALADSRTLRSTCRNISAASLVIIRFWFHREPKVLQRFTRA